jgi:acetyltransferase-like isoleucine patch superfamily enzyme
MKRLFELLYAFFFSVIHKPLEFIKVDLHFVSGWRYYKFKKRLKFLGENAIFWKGVIIHGGKDVSIGENTGIGDYVVIWGGGGVEIGNNVLIAVNSVITSQAHDVDAEIFRLSHKKGKVIIHDNVWLGAGVLVMPGVEIGKNSVIGAGSVVTKNIPQNSVAVGSPAVVIRKRND